MRKLKIAINNCYNNDSGDVDDNDVFDNYPNGNAGNFSCVVQLL